MNTEYAIFRKLKAIINMIRSWFKKNECLDPNAMLTELYDIRLVNHATALEVTIRIRNPGLTSLQINRLHAELRLANYSLLTNPVPVSLFLTNENHQGALLKFLVNTPFLTNTKAVKDISDTIGHDLTQSDAAVSVSIDKLVIDISRGVHSHTVELNDIRDSVKWQREIKGLHYYQR